MVIDMNEASVRTLEQVRQVVAGTQALEFRRSENDEERYRWIGAVLRRFGYRSLKRRERGLLLVYLQRLVRICSYGAVTKKPALGRFRRITLVLLVGETGFEPATSTSRT